MNIIGHRKIYLTISAALVVASIAAVAVFGLKQGIDFVGGSLWQTRFSAEIQPQQIRALLPEAVVVADSAGGFLIRLPEISEEQHQNYAEQLKKELGDFEELRFESIGPVVGRELRTNVLWAFALVLITISLYIAFVFRKVSHPVKSWKYGVITLVTLFHDAIIPVGLIAVMGRYYNVEVGVNLVVAILVVIGFSVHDTIVVLDRTRENLKQAGGGAFVDLVNQSVNQTLARSINTSLTLILILAALYFWGPVSLSYFVLVILAGTIVGTYSSIFVASSLVASWETRN